MRIRLLTIAISFISFTSFASQQVATNISSNVEINPLAQQQKLQKQREIYQKINQFLAISNSEKTRSITSQLLEEIKDYPLYTYAKYNLLLSEIEEIEFSVIDQFEKNNPNFYKTNDLKRAWLVQQQKQENWQIIIDNKLNLPTDTSSQCIVQKAEYEQQKNREKITALNKNALDLSQLWLTGDSLPNSCDPLLAKWFEQGGLTEELVKKRALLAFNSNNTGLLKHLTLQATDPELKIWLTDLYNLRQNSQNLINPDNQFSIEKLLPENENSKIILLNAYPSFIKGLNENDLDKLNPFNLFQEWAIHFNLSEQQINQWKSILLSHIFDTENSSLQKWRDDTLRNLKNDKLLERRIRAAIRQKEDIFKWLNILSDKTKNEQEWQYWLAKYWQKQGKKSKANTIFEQLAKNERGFYPMLAAEELKVAYYPEIKRVSDQQQILNVVQKFSVPLTRIEELYYLDDKYAVNQEWYYLLEQSDFNEKLTLAKYAESKQWFDLQVEATIKAKAWDYIGLRLPNAYQDWFDILLKNRKIHRTFAMAIARQESAWRTDVSSHANARGLMQLLPSTARLTAQRQELPYKKESQLFDPFDNIMLGTQHLQELYDKYGNNRILIAAAYNAGSHRVDQWLDKSQGKLTMAEFIATIPYYETRGYVQNVLAYDYYYQILQHKVLEKFTQEEKNRLY
ncbi:soluble lytic murein transglycosylase [Bisgaardia hudsonensis]|uniref:Soluble lytic murein transglycosylase n=1 Tax=Bisgaardia hudsonensis TaxID=109472 RepID=A0A4R2N3J0_9PAST|nr:transglycosylase SLT domain-containing protein [Bisgaardia hudsonensis]QLB12846.1 hypothetical protein A6A11_04100 [Bisgaardia hudsonensis]TCP14405.1 soluble lytic murein transglycosylase [Bisgaardia hudsonensis]